MDLFDLMQQQTADFERQMTKVIDRLNRKIQKILDGLDVVNGNYVVSGQNLDEALLLSTQLEQALIDSGYPQLAERTIRDNRKLLDLRKEELKTLLGRQRLGGIDPDMFKALQSMDFKGMTGLGSTTLNQIQESLFNSVNLGLSQSTLRNELIKRTNVLKRHAETYIRTSKREYAQHVENGIADQIGFGDSKDDIWEYSPGILQKNSHEECIWAVPKRYFTNEEKMAFEEGGGYAHSEPRWNCVHRFVITNLTYEEAFGSGGISREKLNNILIDEENKIRSLGYERGIGIDKRTGEKLFNIGGSESSIELTDEQVKLLNGNILTHNHPGGSTFSAQDIFAGIAEQVDEIRAVGMNIDKTYTYSMSNLKNNYVGDLQEMFYSVQAQVLKEYKKRGLFVDNDRLAIFNSASDAWGIIAKQYGWKYLREVR